MHKNHTSTETHTSKMLYQS